MEAQHSYFPGALCGRQPAARLPATLLHMQARVQSGVVSLPDGGSKLAAALAQRKEQLRRKRDAAEGRLLTYRDAGSGAVQALQGGGGCGHGVGRAALAAKQLAGQACHGTQPCFASWWPFLTAIIPSHLACVQGPFTPLQLQQLLRAGVVQRDTPVQHPQRGSMPLSEVRCCPLLPQAGLAGGFLALHCASARDSRLWDVHAAARGVPCMASHRRCKV